MAAPGDEGAAAAASYFISLYPYVLATGDLTEWDALSGPECQFCSNTRDEVTDLHSAGRHSTGTVKVLRTKGQDLGMNGWHRAVLETEFSPSSDVDSRGNVIESDDGGTYVLSFAMTWSDGWVIDSVGTGDPIELES